MDEETRWLCPKRFSKRRLLQAAGALALIWIGLAGCSVNSPPVLPALPVNPQASAHPGRIVWYDLFTKDPVAARASYGPLFGWTFDGTTTAGKFQLAKLDGRPVAGLVSLDPEKTSEVTTQWLPNLWVADLDGTVARFAEGGRVWRGPVALPDRGTIAVVEDSEGASLFLLETANGTPAQPEGAPGSFLWTEIWTTALAASSAFYRQAVGYERAENPPGVGPDCRIFGTGGERQVGQVEIPFDGIKPHWLSYLAVDDPAQVAERSVALGDRILIPPEGTAGRRATVVADRSGGVFGIQQWPLRREEEVAQ